MRTGMKRAAGHVTKSRFRKEQEGGAELQDCAEVRLTVKFATKVAVRCNVSSALEEHPYCPDICPTNGEQQLAVHSGGKSI
ncbi:hypothetical protein DIPPA_31784 [Diplonema papillatum]|nr:hypothetical protein DIPPA_31784 [Diplonema papillatum]